MKRIVLASAALVVLIALWVALFVTFRSTEQVLFPGGTYQVYPVTDSTVGGFSTVELSQSDSVISARVNIRSGMAYPYAGMGVNLLSIHNRPASGYFDFSDYDSLIIDAETDRMRKIGVKILNDDPVYSQKNDYRSYRPMVSQVQVRKNGVAVSMLDFKVPEWWFAMHGLEKDDGLRYMNRGMLFEITNGEGTMLGIPDEITVRSIKLWGENRTFKALMYVALAVIAAVYAGVVALAVRGAERSVKKRVEKEENLKSRMASAAKLLREADRSVAEIAIAVGAGSPSSFENAAVSLKPRLYIFVIMYEIIP